MGDKVLVVGSGGREHALVWKLSDSKHVKKIYCAPGNGGISDLAELVDIQPENIIGLARFAKSEKIDLTVVGPEVPLTLGIVDEFEKYGLRIFGPSKVAAQLEGSKVFSKKLMLDYNIPTAMGLPIDNVKDAKELCEMFVEKYGGVVIKADGLAAGKGVKVCDSLDKALEAVNEIMIKKRYGDAGKSVVIEKLLKEEEASILALTDGKTIKTLISSQDHKPIYENERDQTRWFKVGGDKRYENDAIGPNTGGMGAYAPAPIITPDILKRVYDEILNPVVKGMSEKGRLYKGCLYVGLMVTEEGPKVLEFNCRFGDPETQPVLMMLNNDLYELLYACTDGTLHEHQISNKDGAACCVVMTSGGYPGSYEKGKVIHGLNDAKAFVKDVKERKGDAYVFHSGTKDGKTNGGRVLGVTVKGDNIEQAIEDAYVGVAIISWDNEYHRMDIGAKALDK